MSLGRERLPIGHYPTWVGAFVAAAGNQIEYEGTAAWTAGESKLSRPPRSTGIAISGRTSTACASCDRCATFLSFRPGSEQAAYIDELGQVIRIVVGYEQSLAQNGLTVSPGNPRVQISFRIGELLLHGLQILSEALDAGIPR